MLVLEVSAMLTFVGTSGWIGLEVAEGAGQHGAWAWALLPLIVLGYVAADLLTGFFHFFADNFGSERTPVLGPAFVFRFRQHHALPKHICTLSFRQLNGSHVLVAIPLLLPIAWLPIASSGWALSLAVFGWTMLFFGVATNQIHRWAHDARCPAWVRPLQRMRLILSPEHHAIHHRRPHDLHFCITNGWLNALLDRYAVWHHLADLLVALGMPQAPESVLGRARRSKTATA